MLSCNEKEMRGRPVVVEASISMCCGSLQWCVAQRNVVAKKIRKKRAEERKRARCLLPNRRRDMACFCDFAETNLALPWRHHRPFPFLYARNMASYESCHQSTWAARCYSRRVRARQHFVVGSCLTACRMPFCAGSATSARRSIADGKW